MNERGAAGAAGELFVCRYLEKRGFTIVAQNFTRKGGEIDIVAQSATHRLFVEVKTRTNVYFATSEVVTPQKQERIIRTAYRYNAQNPSASDIVYRFDVALLEKLGDSYTLKYIENAFSPSMEWI